MPSPSTPTCFWRDDDGVPVEDAAATTPEALVDGAWRLKDELLSRDNMGRPLPPSPSSGFDPMTVTAILCR